MNLIHRPIDLVNPVFLRPVLYTVGLSYTMYYLFKPDGTQLLWEETDTNVRGQFINSCPPSIIDPTTISIAGSNIWIFGVFQV